jgi:hypothetical protein
MATQVHTLFLSKPDEFSSIAHWKPTERKGLDCGSFEI